MKNFCKLLVAGMLILNSSLLFAAQPKFNIIPTAGSITSLLLPSNFTETVSYQVTNQTSVTRTLTMVPITGVSQTVTGGVCPNPFTLAPGQSCILSLVIHGNQIPSTGISGGPVICKTKGPSDPSPDAFLCSQPSLAATLAVSITSAGQHAYIANQLNNTVSFCQVNPASGLLTQCAITATGLSGVEGIGFNPAGTFFYSANPTSSSISVCSVNQATGALSNCVDSGGLGFSLPDAVAFNPSGTLFYTSNFGSNSVSACVVSATTGLLSGCVTNSSLTFSAPGNMTLNSRGTLAYVVNRVTNTTSVCNVSGGLVNSCNASSGSFFNGPEGITLSPSGSFAYIANAGSKNVVACRIRQDGTGLLDSCSITNGQFAGTGNIGLNNIGTFAYVPNQLLNAVFMCQVSLVDGSLSSCVPSRGTGFSGPAGVVIH